MAKPTDVNWGGNVHGGTAMEWINEAATSVTMAWSGERTVAVYAGGIRFYQPVHIGDLVEVTARLVRPFTPTTDEDRALHAHVARLRALRAEYEPMPLVAPRQATVKMTD
ncbi:MAG: acyl-CoA thioesterase [Rothia sp. (in: high G+C Gram-positive bacteria)]|nr:acyl-CoA thioesterase [Rothia sp. (in: high G+C Gram-positive bacteria)]